jgi:hypothetical protein
MWAVYDDIEKSFLSFLDYVPLTYDHSKVYSHKLLQLILQVGAYVDTSFKEMAVCSLFDGNVKCEAIRKKSAKGQTVNIDLAREAFEPIYRLSARLVSVKSPEYSGRVIVERWAPFDEFKSGRSPRWWQAYNAVKHDWLANLKEANIQNTLYALASAFLLNVVHKPGLQALARSGLVRGLPPEAKIVAPEITRRILEGKRLPKNVYAMVETPLFIRVISPKF